MNLHRYPPFSVLGELHREMDRMLASGLDNDTLTPRADWIPAVDLVEEADDYLVRADIPGVDPRDVEITLEKGVLTLRGERKADVEEGSGKGTYRSERRFGSFVRKFTLPESANAEGVNARAANGVIEIRIPKQAKVLPRRIAIDA